MTLLLKIWSRFILSGDPRRRSSGLSRNSKLQNKNRKKKTAGLLSISPARPQAWRQLQIQLEQSVLLLHTPIHNAERRKPERAMAVSAGKTLRPRRGRLNLSRGPGGGLHDRFQDFSLQARLHRHGLSLSALGGGFRHRQNKASCRILSEQVAGPLLQEMQIRPHQHWRVLPSPAPRDRRRYNDVQVQ